MDWISQFKHEAEFLLINQYLPIDKTKNFQSDDRNNVDHLLYTLKATNNKITNPKSFYAQIGFGYKDSFTDIIRKHSALYKPTSIGPTICILQRLYEELGLTDEFKHEYRVISAKFAVYDHRNLENLFRLNCIDFDDESDCFMDCKYKLIAIDVETDESVINGLKSPIVVTDIEKVTFKYSSEIVIKNNISYKIYVKNKKLFHRNNYVFRCLAN